MGVSPMHGVLLYVKQSLWLTLVILSGCVTVPQISEPGDTPEVEAPTILDAAGNPLTAGKAADMLRTAGMPGQEAMLTELARVDESASQEPLVAGNSVLPLVDGPATFAAMFAAIDAAHDHIHLETFILDDDALGREMAEHLIARRLAGVDVRIIYDAFGSRNISDDFIERLRNANIELYKYHPIDPSEDLRMWRINNRDHRKLLIVDGKVAFAGGINISEVYAENSLSLSQHKRGGGTDRGWRDTHARISGPVVHRFQKLFIRVWKEHEPDAQFDTRRYFPRIRPQGGCLVRLVASRGGDDEYAIYTVYLAAIAHARHRIWITQAYFAPNEAFLEALRDAARRGVDVRLLLPGISDAPLVIQASRADYTSLLKSGVRIFEHTSSTLHAKTAVIDGVWSTIGSANLDYRSFVHNQELNAVIVDHDFGAAMEKLYEVDLQQSREITLQAWRRRPLLQRLKETVGTALRHWF